MLRLLILFIFLISISLNCLSCNDKYLSKYEIETVKFKGKSLDIKRLHTEHFNKKIRTSDIGKEDSIYIVFKQSGHVHLVTQRYKYEASIGYNRSDYFHHNLIKPSFVVELSSKDKNLAEILDKYITRYQRDRFISCAQGICKPLRELGIFDDKVGSHLLPSTLLKSLTKARDSNLQYDYYLIGDSSVNHIYLKSIAMSMQGFLLSFCPLFWYF